MDIQDNLLSRLAKRIPVELSSFLHNASTSANRQQLNLYLVGGIVRDLLLNRANFDIDLVLEGNAIRFAEALNFSKPVPKVVHTRFGTVKFKFQDYNIDIASARKESYSKPGALPDVSPGNIIEDLARRDFTINAMAVRLSPYNPEYLLDPYQGMTDLESKFIRILHDKSFKDDATRMFRAVRYEQRLGFRIEPETVNLIHQDLNMVDTLSKDRVRHELQLFLHEQHPEKCISRCEELGLLYKIHPAIKYGELLAIAYGKARKHFKAAQLSTIYLCLLIYNLTNEQLEDFLNTYNFTRQQVIKMRQTISLKKELEALSCPGLDNWSIFSLMRRYDLSVLQINKIAAKDNKTGKVIDLYLNKLRYIRPQLTGNDLVKLGVKPGSQIGNILDKLHAARINGEIKSRLEEVDIAKELLQDKDSNH